MWYLGWGYVLCWHKLWVNVICKSVCGSVRCERIWFFFFQIMTSQMNPRTKLKSLLFFFYTKYIFLYTMLNSYRDCLKRLFVSVSLPKVYSFISVSVKNNINSNIWVLQVLLVLPIQSKNDSLFKCFCNAIQLWFKRINISRTKTKLK